MSRLTCADTDIAGLRCRDIYTRGPVANFYHSITHLSKRGHGTAALAGRSVEPKNIKQKNQAKI